MPCDAHPLLLSTTTPERIAVMGRTSVGEPIRDFVAAARDDMLAFLQRIVEIESYSDHVEGVDAVGRVMAEAYRSLGFELEEHERSLTADEAWTLRFFLPGHDRLTFGRHVVARRKGDGGPDVLLLCHIDTTFPTGTLARVPFRIEGDLAFGPGVADMKAGVVESLFAVQALDAAGFRDYGRLTVLLVADEEAGSISSRGLIESEARAADVVFCTEPATSDGRLKIRRKGIGIVEIEVRGKPEHVGTGYADGASAVEAMARKVVSLHELTDLGRGIIVNVGELQGGTRRSITAAHALARVDVRVNSAEEWEEIRGCIEAIAARDDVHDTTASLYATLNRPPMVPSERTLALVEVMQRVGRDLGVQVLTAKTSAASDGSFAAAVGTPTIDGMGPIGRKLLTEQEHIVVPTLFERTTLLGASIAALPDA
jgi:glutamate carboxypeptidase